MRQKVIELSDSIRALHKRFLENERIETEKALERRLSPFDFLQLLTSDQAFAWMRPFSALIAYLDAYLADAEDIEEEDMENIRRQIHKVLNESGSPLHNRFEDYKTSMANSFCLTRDAAQLSLLLNRVKRAF